MQQRDTRLYSLIKILPLKVIKKSSFEKQWKRVSASRDALVDVDSCNAVCKLYSSILFPTVVKNNVVFIT